MVTSLGMGFICVLLDACFIHLNLILIVMVMMMIDNDIIIILPFLMFVILEGLNFVGMECFNECF